MVERVSEAFVRTLKNRLNHGKNLVILIVGKVGTGKSYAALRLGERIDPNFSVEHVKFTVDDFLKLLNKRTESGADYLKPGSCIVFDEAGIAAGARNFQSVFNKAMSYVFQIFRHRRLAIILTVPHEKMVDLHLRASTDYRIEMLSVDRRIGKSRAKPLEIQMIHGAMARRINAMFIEKFPRIRPPGGLGKAKVVNRLWFNLPSAKLRNEYEKVASVYKHRVVELQEKKLSGKDKVDEKRKRKVTVVKEIMDEVKKDPLKYSREYKGGNIKLDIYKLAKAFDVSPTTARVVKKLMEVEV